MKLHTKSNVYNYIVLMYLPRVAAQQPPSSFNKLVGENIRMLRLERGMSQADLAARLQAQGYAVHQQGVGKLEQGERPLRFEEAHIIGAILGVDPSGLTQFSPRDESATAFKQFLRAQENVARLERQVEDLEIELDSARRNLQDALIYQTDARGKLTALGFVEVDGMWRLADGEH
jgi:transcriptional regulator with XRE-family HTH domain